MLVSTLVPLALVLALGVVAVAVVRARHRRNVGESQMLPAPTQPLAGGLPWTLLFHRLGKGFWESRAGRDDPTGAPNLQEALRSECCPWKATHGGSGSECRGRAARKGTAGCWGTHPFSLVWRLIGCVASGVPMACLSFLVACDKDHSNHLRGPRA